MSAKQSGWDYSLGIDNIIPIKMGIGEIFHACLLSVQTYLKTSQEQKCVKANVICVVCAIRHKLELNANAVYNMLVSQKSC